MLDLSGQRSLYSEGGAMLDGPSCCIEKSMGDAEIGMGHVANDRHTPLTLSWRVLHATICSVHARRPEPYWL